MRNVRLVVLIILFGLGNSNVLFAQQMLLQEGMRNFQQGNYEQSIDLLEQAIGQDSLQLNAYVLLSASYLKQEVPEVAQLKAEQGLQHFPNVGSLTWLKAEALFQQKLFHKALPLYEELQDKPNKKKFLKPLQVNEQHIKQRLVQVNKALASESFQKNDLAQAKFHINKVLALDPRDSEVQKSLVYLFLRQEEWEKALDTVNKALEEAPENKDLLRMKASALYNLKDYEGLRNEYETLYLQDPSDVKTALIYAEILVGSQKSTEAQKIYEHLLKKYPEDRRIYEALVDVNERRLNIPGKREVLRRMEKQFPEDKSISRNIASTLEQEKKWGAARAVYDSLLIVDGDPVHLQKKIANTYIAQDSLQNAEHLYRQLYQNNKTDEALVLSLGKVLERSENWDEARSIYQQFLSSRETKEVFHRLGIAQMQMGNDQQAIDNFRKALELESDDPEVYLRISQLLAKGDSSQVEEAREKSASALTRTLELLKKNQQKIERQLNNNSLGSQSKNAQQFEKLEKLDALAKESFKHFTNINKVNAINEMFVKLEETYPGSGRLFYLMGNYFSKEGRSKKARSFYQKAVQYTPKLREAHLAYAILLEENGQYRSAITSYERTLSLDPQKPEAYDALIRLYRKQGELNKLCDRWMSRYRADVDNQMLKEFLIEALHKTNRFEEAQKLINSQ